MVAPKKNKTLQRRISSGPAITTVMGINVKKFLKLLKKRSGKDDLFRMVDELQAMLVISNLSVIESIQESISDGEAVEAKIEDKIKLINAMKGATASVNDAFKTLGVSVSSREVEAEDDDALRILSTESIQKNIPPVLEAEFLKAKEDIERISKTAPSGLDPSLDGKDVLSEIKKPLSSFDRKEPEKKEEEKVVNVDFAGVGKLK